MYIKSVKLENIKGFGSLEFQFTRKNGAYAGWTVFTGDNGSGKSTLLKAIALCLTGSGTAHALQPNLNGWVTSGKSEGSIELEIERTDNDDGLTATGKSPAQVFPAKIVLLSQEGKETTLQPSIPESKPQNQKWRAPDRTIWSQDVKGWFSCGYGPFRRVFGASSEAVQQMVTKSTARYVTLFQEAASLAQADTWLRDLKFKELENRQAEKDQLDLLLKVIGDDLLPEQLTVDRVDSNGFWLKDRNGIELSWREMSDGYRAMLALLTDIVRHLIDIYGIDGLTGTDDQGRTYFKRSGVVLIDEIDAHLHPSWQRTIGFWLKRHFPNIQFLVTTHSPLVCQAVDDHGLFVLPPPASGTAPYPADEKSIQRIISATPDEILLTPVFGLQNTRSEPVVQGRAEYARLQAKKHSGAQLSSDEIRSEKQLELFINPDKKS